MSRTTRFAEYTEFKEAIKELEKPENTILVVGDYVIIKKSVWDSSVNRIQQHLNERKLAESAIYSNS